MGTIRTWQGVAIACLLLAGGCSKDAAEEEKSAGEDADPSESADPGDASAPASESEPKDAAGGSETRVDASQQSPSADPMDASDDGGPSDAGPSVPVTAVSDDFSSGVLDPELWTVVDPRGDGEVTLVGAGTEDARLQLAIPPGVAHDPWIEGNEALRVMQPKFEGDFQLEVKFESKPVEQYQIQGIMVEADPLNFVRFDVHHDRGELIVYTATFTDGTPAVRSVLEATLDAPIYLRLAREDNAWQADYSADGDEWFEAGSFSYALAAAAAGVFVGNAEPNPAAFTAEVDYFFNTASPIEPEDGSPE